MSLAHAILVSLSSAACSGYDLAKKFDGSVGFFWKATHQQIYRELTKLEEQGWLSAEPIPQEGRPDKKLYSLTETGRDRLKEWLVQPCEPSPDKEEILIKVFAGYLVPEQAIAKEIERHRQLHAERLVVYQHIEQAFFSNVEACSKESKFAYLTLRCGIRFEKEWIAWCEETLQSLQKMN